METRRELAAQISGDDGHPIMHHNSDWTFFVLNDPLTNEQGTMHTCFEWDSRGQRWEGFVSYADSR